MATGQDQTLEAFIKIISQYDISDFTKGSARIRADASSTGATISKTWGTAARDSEKAANTMSANLSKAFDNIGRGADKARGLLDKVLGPLGIGLGVGALIKQSFALNQTILGWHNSFRSLSDATGDTSKAVSTMTAVWGKTGASLQTVQSTMQSMGAHGLPVANKEFKDMAIFIANVSNASGISTDALAGFTVGLNQMYGTSLKATRQITSSMLALGDGFGFTGPQVEAFMKSTQGALEKMGAFFDNVDAGMKDMAKGMAAGAAAMKQLGVSAQTAGNFMTNILDPDKINEHMHLFARMGINYQETMDMMDKEGGQLPFIEKAMKSLPELSKQIMEIKNPIARASFAKKMGLDLQMVKKAAKGTREEIAGMMEEYKNKAKDEEAVKKKQEKAKADQARFDEALMFLKMNALMPIMNFVNKNIPVFFQVMGKISDVFQKFSGGFATVMQKVVDVALPPLNALLSGDISKFWDSLSKGLSSLISFAFEGLVTILPGAIKTGISFIWEGIKTMFTNHPLITAILGLMIGLKAYYNLTSIKNAYDVNKKMNMALGPQGLKVVMASGPGTTPDLSGSKGGKKGFLKGKGGLIAGAAMMAGGAYLSSGEEGGIKSVAGKGLEYAGVGQIAYEGLQGTSVGAKIGGFASKAGGKALGFAGKGLGALGKLAGPLAILTALYGMGSGAANVGKILGTGSMDKGDNDTLKDLRGKKARGEEMSKDQQRQLSILEDKKAGKIKDEITGMDRFIGGLYKASSLLTMGLVGGDEALREKYDNMRDGGKKEEKQNQWLGDMNILGGGNKNSLARRTTGKMVFDEEEKVEQERIAQRLKAAREGNIKITDLEKEQLEARNDYLLIVKKNAWTTEDSVDFTAKQKRVKELIENNKNLSGIAKQNNEKEIQNLNIHLQKLNDKRDAMSTSWGDTFLGIGAKVAKFFNMDGSLPEIKFRIQVAMKGAAEMLGIAIDDLFRIVGNWFGKENKSAGYKKAVEKFQAAQTYALQVDIKTGQRTAAGTKAMNDIDDVRKTMIRLNETDEAERIQKYVTKNAERVEYLKEESKGIRTAMAIEAAREKAEAAKDKKTADAQKIKLLGGIAGSTKVTADAVAVKTDIDKQDYISYWMRNQGFQGLSYQVGGR